MARQTQVWHQWNGAVVLAKVHAAAGAGAHSAARTVLRDANDDCPVDTGAMRASGGIAMQDGVAVVGYLRPGPDGDIITRRQHEDLTLNHPNGGTAKWLQNAIERYAGQATPVEMIGPIQDALR